MSTESVVISFALLDVEHICRARTLPLYGSVELPSGTAGNQVWGTALVTRSVMVSPSLMPTTLAVYLTWAEAVTQ
jgi:hypothetical protein